MWGDRFGPVGFPGSTYVAITRSGTTTWVITAAPGAPGGDIAYVRSTTNTKGRAVEVFEGLYRLPFQMTVVEQPAP